VGDCEVDPDLFELRRGGVPVPMEPQAFEVLVHLISHRDRMVTMSVRGGYKIVWKSVESARILDLRGSITLTTRPPVATKHPHRCRRSINAALRA